MTIADEPLPRPAFAHPLWERLTGFDFDAAEASDGGRPIRTFALRLGAKQGWTDAFTARVVEEYRRFLFLTVAAGHPVCPSEHVDEAWHHHLTDTRSYWHRLCGAVLGAPLHHDAARGGPGDARRHREMYRATLDAYRAWFGSEPPADIWPPAWRRFDAGHRHVAIDVADHWVIRRPRWWPRSRVARASLATVPLVAVGPLVADGLGPLDLRGPEFLLLYGSAWLAILVGAIILRSRQRDVPTADSRELTPEEIACLARGPKPAIRAVVAGMLDAGELSGASTSRWTSSARTFSLTPTGGRTIVPGDVARSIRGACPAGGCSLADLESNPQVTAASDVVRGRLLEAGWLVDEDRVWAMRWIPIGAFALLLLGGLLKIGIGVERHRPVGFLVVACIATAVSIVWAARTPRTSQAAESLLATMKVRSGSTPPANPADLVLLAGLFGVSALGSDHLAPYKKVWQSEAPQGGSGGCGSGCSGGAGCGGGGDGGGGCGGGCGGCGS